MPSPAIPLKKKSAERAMGNEGALKRGGVEPSGKGFSSVVDKTSRRVEESKKSADEQRGKFAAQRAVEEESLPLVALLTFADHEIRT